MRVTIGFEVGTGAKVEMSINHTVITGITGSGKTTLAKRIIDQADRAIVFDIKNDYVDMYPTLATYPPRVSSKLTDPLMLKEILEVYSGMSLRGEFPELIKLAHSSKTIFQLSRNLQDLLTSSRIHPFRKDKLLVINEILKNFIDEIRPLLVMRRFNEAPKIRIDLSQLSYPIQQFVIAEEIKLLKDNYKVFIDEAHRFIPQSFSSISKRQIVNLLREGRSKGNFAFLIDQTITGILKDALKQCWNWIIGKQLELNEVKKVTKQILGHSIKPETVASLRVGEFLFFTPGETYKFYAWPLFMSKQEAQEIAIEMGDSKIISDNGIENSIPFVNHRKDVLHELIKAVNKIILVISNLIEKKNDKERIDVVSTIIQLLRRTPGITFNKLQTILKEMGFLETDIGQGITKLIDEGVITIEPSENEIRFYLNDNISYVDYIEDWDLT